VGARRADPSQHVLPKRRGRISEDERSRLQRVQEAGLVDVQAAVGPHGLYWHRFIAIR